jgi:shikimate dehydrogenase
MSISGKTRVFAVAGSPVAHSLSPAMHNGWYADHGLDAVYVALPVAAHIAVETFDHAFDLGLQGLNITVPFKEAAARAAVSLDPAAAHLEAANVLAPEAGGWRAFNTDAPGFVASLEEAAPGWRDRVETAVVLGAGGAGRAIAYGLQQAGVPRVLILNRDPDRGAAAGRRLGLEVWGLDRLAEAFAIADLIANATTLGMGANPAPDWPLAAAHPNAIMADAVYAPLETALLRQARARGLTAVDGLGMLIHQGALAFEHWFGIRPDAQKARARLLATLAERAP